MHKVFSNLKGFKLKEFNTESIEAAEDLNDYLTLRFPEKDNSILLNECQYPLVTYQRGDVDAIYQYDNKRFSLIMENFFED